MKIFHILASEQWEKAQKNGRLISDSLISDGYIHCCTEGQINFVIEKWFPEDEGLVIVALDTEKISSPVRFEESEMNQEPFPHVYGSINLDAVTGIEPISKERKWEKR